MSFGQTLRTAREAKGLTASKLASLTHLLVQIIEGLENEDFRRIPAPIYGRGFVKLYCEVVGLDPKPLQAEFMSLYTRSKEAPAKTGRSTPPSSQKEIPPAPPAVVTSTPPSPQQIATPEEEPTPEPPPAVEKVAPETEPPSVFETNLDPEPPPVVEEVTPETEPLPVVEKVAPETEPPSVVETNLEPEPPSVDEEVLPETEPPPRRSYGELFEHTYAQEEPEKPSAAEKFRDTMSNVSHGVFANVKKLPPNTGRIVMVSIAAIILLVLIGWGITALYKATTPQPSGEEVKGVSQPKQETVAKPSTATDKTTSTPKSLSKKNETTSSKTAPLPTKRATTSEKGKSKANAGALKSSGIQIPSLYID